MTAYEHAIRFLKRRLLSRQELAEKLLARNYAEADVLEAIEKLSRLGFLDDKRIAESRALDGVSRKRGRHDVRRKLDRAGVDETLSHDAVEETYAAADEPAMARELLRKRSAGWANLEPAAKYRRAVGLLLRRGFDDEIIRPAIADVLGIDSEIDISPDD